MKSHLYILQCEQFFKIGYTTKPVKERVKRMTTGNPFFIKIIIDACFDGGNIANGWESTLHNKYSKKNTLGEWFVLDPKHIFNIINEIELDGKLEYCRLINEPKVIDPTPKLNYWKYKYINTMQEVSFICIFYLCL